MTLLFLVVVAVVLLFGFVVLFGAPYLPTLTIRTKEALELLDLKPGQTLVELGSGDGRVLRAAAERGIHAIGYELNPLLVIWSKITTRRYSHLVTVRLANFWTNPLPQTDAIYVFLLDRYMKKLDKKIIQDTAKWDGKKQLKLVSFAFKIPGKKPIKEKNGLYLYHYN